MNSRERVINILQRKPVDHIPVDIWHTPEGDNQYSLPRGTAEDVRKETLNCLETLGRDKEGFICCSCHNIQAGTPVENIITMIETVKNWCPI